jgi:hypothetical protein
MELALSISLATQAPMQYFHRSILNLTPAGSLSFGGFEISAYRFGNSTLKLALPPKDMQPEPKTPDFKNGFISLRITDVEAVLKEAKREGVKMFIPLMEGEVGDTGKAKAAFLVDPMGNLVEVVEISDGRVAWD